MISTVLAALDHTERAPRVLRAASEIADRFDAVLRIFRAVPLVQTFPAAASNAAHPDALPEYLRIEAVHAMEALALALGNPRAMAHPPIVSVGNPVRAILAAADSINADLIVLGSHGLHGLDHLFGTVTGTVTVRSARNVFVVHSD